MFVFAAVVIASAEPSPTLVATGQEFNISEFLLIQWLAPGVRGT